MALPSVGGVSDADEAGEKHCSIGLGEASHSAYPRSRLLWLLAGTVAAIAIAWFVAQIHLSGHAPVGIVSLSAGVLLGVALSRLAKLFGVGCKYRLTVGTVLLAILLVLAEHAWLYRDYRGQWQAAREASATVAMFRPEAPPGPSEYFAHEWNLGWGLWLADAVMILAGAVGTVVVTREGGRFGLAADAKGEGLHQ